MMPDRTGTLPLIRLPAPSPRMLGEGIRRTACFRFGPSRGASPLPACGERVRVGGSSKGGEAW